MRLKEQIESVDSFKDMEHFLRLCPVNVVEIRTYFRDVEIRPNYYQGSREYTSPNADRAVLEYCRNHLRRRLKQSADTVFHDFGEPNFQSHNSQYELRELLRNDDLDGSKLQLCKSINKFIRETESTRTYNFQSLKEAKIWQEYLVNWSKCSVAITVDIAGTRKDTRLVIEKPVDFELKLELARIQRALQDLADRKRLEKQILILRLRYQKKQAQKLSDRSDGR